MSGRRSSGNIDDRRGSGPGRRLGIGGGIIGVIIVAAITLFSGGGIGDVIGNIMGSGALQPQYAQQDYTPDAEDERLATFASQVLAGTEDVSDPRIPASRLGRIPMSQNGIVQRCRAVGMWKRNFANRTFLLLGRPDCIYRPRLFKGMKNNIGADGDFAYAYVIAHEVGHHVQHLLGTLDQAHSRMSRLSEREANRISVRLELRADFYAGVWAALDNEMFNSIEEGDVENAINAASKIGDDYLQRQAYGREIPDSFNHGRSEQRVRWLTKGIQTGNPNYGDTFTPAYSEL